MMVTFNELLAIFTESLLLGKICYSILKHIFDNDSSYLFLKYTQNCGLDPQDQLNTHIYICLCVQHVFLLLSQVEKCHFNPKVFNRPNNVARTLLKGGQIHALHIKTAVNRKSCSFPNINQNSYIYENRAQSSSIKNKTSLPKVMKFPLSPPCKIVPGWTLKMPS